MKISDVITSITEGASAEDMANWLIEDATNLLESVPSPEIELGVGNDAIYLQPRPLITTPAPVDDPGQRRIILERKKP